MFRVIFCILMLVVFGLTSEMALAKQDQEIQSTQGYEFTQQEQTQLNKKTKNEQKSFSNRYNKVIRKKHELQRNETLKTKKEKELKYLESRLNTQKVKLESLSSKEEKGE